MKRLCVLCIVILVILLSVASVVGCAEKEEAPTPEPTPTIVAGKGIGQITVDQHYSLIEEIMGKPKERTTFEQEKKKWIDFGHDIDKSLQYNLGFDSCFEYSRYHNSSVYPIYKIYFKDEKVLSITLSVYPYNENFFKSVCLADSQLSFLSGKREMERVLGKDYFFREDNFGYEYYEYLEKGITFLIKEEEITVIYIYKAFTTRQKEEYIRAFP